MRKNKKAILGLAALAAMFAIGGTWAFWSQDLSAKNVFQTGTYDSDIVEKFTPPATGEWLPGVTVEKQVRVKNNGNVKMAVTAEIDQVWIRTENVYNPASASEATPSQIIAPAAGENFDLMFLDDSGKFQYATIINWGEDVAALESISTEARDALGFTASDSVVAGLDDTEAKDKWILIALENDAETNAGGNGYSRLQFIYNGVVDGAEETPMLLTGATLNPQIKGSVTAKHTEVYADENGNTVKKTVTSTNPKYGYDSARYTMTIHAVTVQATEAAVKEVFGNEPLVSAQLDTWFAVNEEELMEEYLEGTPSQATP